MTLSAGSKLFSALFIAAAALGAVPQAGGAAPVGVPLVTGLPDFTDLIDKVGPAVVDIRTTEKLKPGERAPTEDELLDLLRRYHGAQDPRGRRAPQPPLPAPSQEDEVQRGVGSGFLMSADGYVLTNAHVVDGADEVLVTLTDRREFKARVLGSDKRSDVALLKLDAQQLPSLTIGDSGKIRVGEWVIAIGSPFNLNNTVTAGIISAKSRDTGDYLPLIQSDVAVNPGNSGGPLINMRGEVIGINSQIATLSGGYNGISFAVPIDEVMRVAEQLKKSGKVTRGRLGVEIDELTREVAEALGLDQARGVEVVRVEAGGPADKDGIKVGDIILKFNGQEIDRSGDLPRLVGATAVGSKAVVTVWRQGRQKEITVGIVTLDDDKAARKPGPKKPAPDQPANALGLHVSDLSEAQRKQLQIDAGVLVDASEALAARAGLRPGDLILQLNNVEVKDAKQFNALVGRLDTKKNAVVLVRRDDATQYVVIHPKT
ncbi:DegQ family serine endoprotease [Massilia sp. DJPM01]|uniref:DegQ family serine endoprotease n=1 Tax=Massilia sp. DJPM01 TaxID=3024404 RepID=UPI00259F16AA|nr:DegQ family serine endoprotease [Massilia sp. DJPM01]MDM5175790.1 DegQ family serine endoprotease [Massilia sp. DJPM01]